MPPRDIQELEADSTLVGPFGPESLTPKERKLAKQLAGVGNALLLKSLFHRLRPDEYRISSDRDSAEYHVAAITDAIINPRLFARIQSQVEALYQNPARVAGKLDRLAHLDLRAPDLDLRIQQVSPGLTLKVRRKKLDFSELFPETQPEPQPEPEVPLPDFKRLTLVLRKLHCVDETNSEGGADDMVLGGVMVNADGSTSPIKAFFAGNFDDGYLKNFGALPLGGQYSLTTTAGYPKLFFFVFSLIESDSDDQEVADTLTNSLSIAATYAAFWYPTVGLIAKGVLEFADLWLDMFFGDDHFPPYGIQLKLHSADQFGPSGTAPPEHTDNITAEGGAYRIGYRWELSA